MPAILGTILTIAILFLVAWFCFWLIDQLGPPAPFTPLIFILKLVVVIIFLCVALGLFGVFGSSFHPVLFGR